MKRKRSTRRKTTKGENKWISCDCCLEWCHPFCCGLEREEFLKLDAGIRSNKKAGKSDIFFKCVLCNLKTFDLIDSVQNFRDKVVEKIECASVPISDSDLNRESLGNSGSLSTKEDTVQVTSSEEDRSENSKSIEFVVQNEEEIREKIIIIDELDKPQDFRHSSTILKEIKKVSDQKVELAYPLSKGCIAIIQRVKTAETHLLICYLQCLLVGEKLVHLTNSKKFRFSSKM